MMKITTGKLFSTETHKLTLNDLLKSVPENNWNWFLYEIDAVGCALYGLSIPDFEALVLSTDDGLEMTWDDVKLLAHSLEEIKTFFIVAHAGSLAYECIDVDNLTNCFAIIHVFDSSYWEIKIKARKCS